MRSVVYPKGEGEAEEEVGIVVVPPGLGVAEEQAVPVRLRLSVIDARGAGVPVVELDRVGVLEILSDTGQVGLRIDIDQLERGRVETAGRQYVGGEGVAHHPAGAGRIGALAQYNASQRFLSRGANGMCDTGWATNHGGAPSSRRIGGCGDSNPSFGKS